MRRISRDGEATEFFGGHQGESLRASEPAQGHPNLITKWKRQASEGMVDVFSGKPAGRDGSHEAEIKELHAKIGELTVEKGGVARRFALWPRPSVVEPHLH